MKEVQTKVQAIVLPNLELSVILDTVCDDLKKTN